MNCTSRSLSTGVRVFNVQRSTFNVQHSSGPRLPVRTPLDDNGGPTTACPTQLTFELSTPVRYGRTLGHVRTTRQLFASIAPRSLPHPLPLKFPSHLTSKPATDNTQIALSRPLSLSRQQRTRRLASRALARDHISLDMYITVFRTFLLISVCFLAILLTFSSPSFLFHFLLSHRTQDDTVPLYSHSILVYNPLAWPQPRKRKTSDAILDHWNFFPPSRSRAVVTSSLHFTTCTIPPPPRASGLSGTRPLPLFPSFLYLPLFPSFLYLPCAFAFASRTRTRFGPDLSRTHSQRGLTSRATLRTKLSKNATLIHDFTRWWPVMRMISCQRLIPRP